MIMNHYQMISLTIGVRYFTSDLYDSANDSASLRVGGRDISFKIFTAIMTVKEHINMHASKLAISKLKVTTNITIISRRAA